MPRSFRFEPPEPRPRSLTRPRLLRRLLDRWEHRVTTVVGGPGLGKTTLLAQAVAENRLAPRGADVWIGIEPADVDGEPLARDVLAAVLAAHGVADGGGDRAAAPPATSTAAPASPGAVADAIWRRSPTAVCLVLDDVHLLTAGSAGAAWLAGLVEALPANGHVLLASRVEPAVPLARLSTQGAVARLTEDDLRFTGDEIADFAARRGIDDVGRFGDTGGWPAMAELTASVDAGRTGDYLWEEVLEPLGSERRRVLAVVADLGGADDALAAAALGPAVDLDRALAGVPLVARGADGWCVPHPLWRTVDAITLTPAEREAVRRPAIDLLVRLNRYDDALALAGEAGLDDVVPEVLRAACIGPDRPPLARLERWLDDLPPAARGTPGAALAAGLHAALTRPGAAAGPLRDAAARCRDAGDVDAELGALAVLGRVAWWRADLALLGELFPRVLELEGAGHPMAAAIAAIGRAVLADLAGDDEAVLGHLDEVQPGLLDPGWVAVADWLRAVTLAGCGRAQDALAVLDGIPPSPDPAFGLTVEGARQAVRWSLGHVDEVVARLPDLVDRIRAAGVAQNVVVAHSQAALVLGLTGDAARGRRYLDAARRASREGRGPASRLAAAEAAVLVAEGDEPAGAALLHGVLAGRDPSAGDDRRAWRDALALTYLLVPATRPRWDRAELRGHLALARGLAAALAAWRDGDTAALTALELPDHARVRAALPLRHAAELAAALQAAGRPEGGPLLEALGPRGRDAARALAAGGARAARPARSLLAAVPGPPPHVTGVGVLGPLEIVRDGKPVTDGELRRERVRALLSFLVGHRRTTRAAITAALWPDLDDRAAANNLRVTTTYLLRVLEPWREAREPSYFVRQDGTNVTLVAGDRLRVDADRFDAHLGTAERAERDGSPSVALEHWLAAVDLYRGPAHEGVAPAEWIDLEREHYATRFVAAATRAGELLLGLGEPARAEEVARRAVGVDPWAEAAHGVLVAAALARGDRAGARRALDRTLDTLAELGLDPSPQTQSLRRRVRSRT
ncbi:MAG TPA: BTAD domain-containing putative transcriptional regulator [Acidimicrobiales bacterium]